MIGCECPVCRSLDPRDHRLRVAVHLDVDGRSFVIDTGPDFRQQMLRARVNRLDAVLFTHEHKDHTAGLDDIRAFNFRQQQEMPVYAESRVIRQLKQEFAYIFAEQKYPGVPQVSLHHISHFTLGQAVEVLEELQPRRAYLTHISHQLGRHREVEAELPSWIRLAYDGLQIEV
jgi:phosphoribosyl 1,2-cyclic phosphodiesterase